MRPTDYEYKLILKEDERIRKFKEAEWERLGHGDPRGMLLECFIFSFPFIGWGLLLLNLMYEWFYRLGRMLCIAVKVGYIHSRFAIDRFETKLFDIWRKMI